MSLVKWTWDHEIRDLGRYPTRPPYAGHSEPVHIIPLADLKEVVEGLRTNIAHSFINTDEISAYRLACEHILAQLAPGVIPKQDSGSNAPEEE